MYMMRHTHFFLVIGTTGAAAKWPEKCRQRIDSQPNYGTTEFNVYIVSRFKIGNCLIFLEA